MSNSWEELLEFVKNDQNIPDPEISTSPISNKVPQFNESNLNIKLQDGKEFKIKKFQYEPVSFHKLEWIDRVPAEDVLDSLGVPLIPTDDVEINNTDRF